jgi:hypothetical protein
MALSHLLPALLLAGASAGGGLDAREFRRGTAAVDTRASHFMALRAEANPSPSFRLGAAFQAWHNASAAVVHDATHTTGDGGDARILAEDCSDERIAFTALEAERVALGLSAAEVLKAAEAGVAARDTWEARKTAPLHYCV